MNQNDIMELAKGHTDIWKAGYEEGLKRGFNMREKLVKALKSVRESLINSKHYLEFKPLLAMIYIALDKAREEPKS